MKRDWRSQISMEGWRQKEDEEEAMRKGETWLQHCPVSIRQHLLRCGPTPGMLKKGQEIILALHVRNDRFHFSTQEEGTVCHGQRLGVD